MDGTRWPRLALVLALGAAALGACRDTQVLQPCGGLPDRTACPASRGGTCADPACSALYVCEDRSWVFVTDCPANIDAGVDAPLDAPSDGAPDGAICDAAPRAPDPACPPLQLPDCDLAIADACPGSACKEGCTGFLRCTPQGWTTEYAAYCDEDGALVK